MSSSQRITEADLPTNVVTLYYANQDLGVSFALDLEQAFKDATSRKDTVGLDQVGALWYDYFKTILPSPGAPGHWPDILRLSTSGAATAIGRFTRPPAHLVWPSRPRSMTTVKK